MTSLNNIVNFLGENWTYIVIIITIIIGAYCKIMNFIDLSEEEKVEAAKKAIDEIILDLMSDAEICFQTFYKSGDLKRSQVISRIYEKFPILKTYIDQDEIIDFIDNTIDSNLHYLDKIMENTDKVAKGELPDDYSILDEDDDSTTNPVVDINFNGGSIQMFNEVETDGIGESEQNN